MEGIGAVGRCGRCVQGAMSRVLSWRQRLHVRWLTMRESDAVIRDRFVEGPSARRARSGLRIGVRDWTLPGRFAWDNHPESC